MAYGGGAPERPDWLPIEPEAGDMVERMVARARLSPDFPAVVTHGGERLTFRDVLGQAGALAPLLREVATDGVVGFVAGFDSFATVATAAAAIAGVRVVGADAADSPDRLAALFTSVGCPVVMRPAHAHVAALLGPSVRCHVIEPPEPIADIDGLTGHPDMLVTTSGSTSDPKVAIIPLSRWYATASMKRDTFRRCRLMVAGVGTYAHVNSAITSMCRGGTLAMFDPRVGSTTELVGFLTEHDVTSLSVTPTMAHAISRATGGTPVDAPVEYVNVRGERVGGNDLKVLHQLFPFAQIAHMYATTETSRIALWTWNIGDPVPEGLLPLGPPSEGCIVRFVGADGEVGPAPRGQPEELLVRAPTIFDGYVGRDPDDGFVVAEGQRWYRTGDLVSVDDEGSLRVHGRVGRRVKVAGQFVDLDDVANAFERLDGVARAAVTYFDVGESARLVGHLVPERGAPLDPVALRARLADDLPIHMVPSLVRIVDEPPLNRSGKIDHLELARWRPALPDHSAHDRILEMSTPTEARLLSLATTLVGRPVTLDDDLIDVGMVSVAWVELVERIKADFGTDVELGELLAAPTVRGIATLLDAERPERSLVALSAGSGLTPIVWVPNGIAAQEAIPLSRALPGHPVYVPLLKGFGRPGRIALRVDDVVADMAEAIEAELPSGGFALAGFSAGCHHAQALAARLAADGRDVELLILLDPPSGRGGWRAVLSRCKRELEAVAAKPHLRRHVAGTEVCHPKWLWWAMRRDQVRHRPPVYDGATLVVRTSQMAGRPAPVSLTGPVWVERVVGDHLAVITDVEPVAGHIADALAAGRSGSGQRADSAS